MTNVLSRKRGLWARSAITTGALLLAWNAAQLIVSREFGAIAALLSVLGALLLISGWVSLNRDRVGQAFQEIAEAIDPLITPPRRGRGHAHVSRGRSS